MANAQGPNDQAATERGASRILGVVADLRVPHQLMRKTKLAVIVDGFVLVTIGSTVLSVGRRFNASGQQELAENLVMTVACYLLMFIAGVIGILVSPNATLKDDTAKLTKLIYFVFLGTILLFAAISCIVSVIAGDTPVNLLREFSVPLTTRLAICAFASAAAISFFASRTRRFYRGLWDRAQDRWLWIVLYWVLTSFAAAVVLTYPQD